MIPTNNSFTLLFLIPTRAIAVQGYAMIVWGREERPPSPKRDGGASAARSSGPQALPSPAAPKLAPGTPSLSRPPTLSPFALLFLPPALSLVHPPRRVPSSRDTCPPHPCQGFREPSRPLPCLPPTATTMPTTSAASKPQWTHFLRMTGRGPPSPRCRRPHLPERVGVGREGRRTPCRSRDHAAARSGASAPSSLVVVIGGGGSACGAGFRTRRQRRNR